MSPRLQALADQVKASPEAQAAIAHALIQESELCNHPTIQQFHCGNWPHEGRRRYTIPESRSDRRKRLAALLRDHKDILPDWTALCSMARARGFFPSPILDRDIIQTLKAIGNDYGILPDEVASAREFLKGDGPFVDRDAHVNETPQRHITPAAAGPTRPLLSTAGGRRIL